MIWDKANEKTQSTKSTWVVNNFGTKKKTQNLLQFGLLINFKGLFILKVILIFQVCFLQRRKKKNLIATFQNSHFFSRKVISSLLFDPSGFLIIMLYIYP